MAELLQLLTDFPILGGGILALLFMIFGGLIHLKWQLDRVKEEVVEIREDQEKFMTSTEVLTRIDGLKELMNAEFGNMKEAQREILKSLRGR